MRTQLSAFLVGIRPVHLILLSSWPILRKFFASVGDVFQIDGLNFQKKEIEAFVFFDETHTRAPQNLANPGGYYRTLIVKFQLAQGISGLAATIEAPEQPVCVLGSATAVGKPPARAD